MVITDQASVSAMFYQDMISGLWAGTDIWLNTNSSYWSLADYENNATVMTNVQRAAKNIIYAITNSNAVQDYESGGLAETDFGMPAWKIWLIIIDIIIFGGCAALIAVSVILFVRSKQTKVGV